MSITMIKDLARAVRQARTPRTISQLADAVSAATYRHPDSAQISYPKAVNQMGPIGVLPGRPLSIGIVGAGPGGIAALYELSRMATADTPIEVALYESDMNNFLFNPKGSEALTRRCAGRVSSYWAGSETSANTVYEIGAMRFPEIAGLTWHYAKAVLQDPDTAVCQQFPNPGTVPTQFVFGSQQDFYMGAQWSDPDSPTLRVKQLVLLGLFGVAGSPPPVQPFPTEPVYRIGTRDGAQANALLTEPDATQSDLQEFSTAWQLFIQEHDGTSLEGAVRHVLTTYRNQNPAYLPTVPGLTGEQLISWCVELFGRFGFGTGGFKPLFNMSLVEMMRLLLWDYANEYTFPKDQVPGNVDFIEAIYNRAIENTHLTVTHVQARVSDVMQAFTGACIAFYRSKTAPIEFGTHDYGIIALPHDAAALIVSRLGYRNDPLVNYQVGDFGATALPPGGQVFPALRLSTSDNQQAVTARMISAVGTMHMTASSKVFATIGNIESAEDVPEFCGAPISAVISDCGLAATYMVPSTTNPDKKSFLVSYSWDDDSSKLQNTFSLWPEYDSNAPAADSSMFDAMINRAYRLDPTTEVIANAPKWWLAETLNRVDKLDKVAYDWSTYTTAGGFKLDMTGDTYQSSLCFRYHTHAAVQGLNNKFFLAGCSFSHLGGWLEGAFMSAINAVAGVVVAANDGSTATLNSEALKLFTTLTPIVPMN